MKKTVLALLLSIKLINAAEFAKDQAEYLFGKVISPIFNEKDFNGGTKESKKFSIGKGTFSECLQGQNISNKRFHIAYKIMKCSPHEFDFYSKLDRAPIEVLLAYGLFKNYHMIEQDDQVSSIQTFTEKFARIDPKYSYLKLLFPINILRVVKEEEFFEFYKLFKEDSDYVRIRAIHFVQNKLYKTLNFGANMIFQKAQNSDAKDMMCFAKIALDMSTFANSMLESYLKLTPELRNEPGVSGIKKNISERIKDCTNLIGNSTPQRQVTLPVEKKYDICYSEMLNYLRTTIPNDTPNEYLKVATLAMDEAHENNLNHHIEEIIALATKNFTENVLKTLPYDSAEMHHTVIVFFGYIFNRQKLVPESKFKELKDRMSKILFEIQNDYESIPNIASFLKLDIAQASLSKGAEGGIYVCENPNTNRITIFSFDEANAPKTEDTLRTLENLGLTRTPFHQKVASTVHQEAEDDLEKFDAHLGQLKKDYEDSLSKDLISTSHTSSIIVKSGSAFNSQLVQELTVKIGENILPNNSFKDILNKSERNSKLTMDPSHKELYDTSTILFEEAEGCRIKGLLINTSREILHTFTFHGVHGENKNNISPERKEEIKRLSFEQWKILTQKN